MAETGNEIPASNRLHIGVFGRTNSGKSSFINAFTGQQVSPEQPPIPYISQWRLRRLGLVC